MKERMQPQYSPDGRYWWDGRQWQPAPPQQPAQPQHHLPGGPPPGAPAPGAPAPGAPPPGWPPQPGGPATRRKSRKWPLIIAGVIVVVLIVIAVPAIYVLTRDGGQSAGSSPEQNQPPPSTGIEPGDEITEEKLRQADPGAFHRELLKRQMTRPVSVISDAYFERPEDFRNHDHYYVNRVGIDHSSGDGVDSKEFTSESAVYRDQEPDDLSRCVQGKYYYLSEDFDTGRPEWQRMAESDQDCQSITSDATPHSTDGIVASGLTEQQADKVLAKLVGEYEFGTAEQPTLITGQGGKTYIRQIVEYEPVKLADGMYWGTQIFTWSFKESGLDPETWPWASGFGPGEGVHAVYYIDTETLLPSVLLKRSTPVLDENGEVKESYDQTHIHSYGFPEQLKPKPLKNMKAPRVTLPEGWKIPE